MMGDGRTLELEELVRDGVKPLLDRRWAFLADETWNLFRRREREMREIAGVVDGGDMWDNGCLKKGKM